MRDRLKELQQAMPDEDSVSIMVAGTNYKDSRMSKFNEEVENIKNNIEEIEKDVEIITKMHSEIILNVENDKKNKLILEELMDDIKKKADRVRLKLKEIEHNIDKAKDKGENESAEQRIKKTQHTLLLKNFLNVMTRYNSTQVDYRDRCIAKIQRKLEIAGQKCTPEELEDFIASNDSNIFIQGVILDSEQKKDLFNDIKDRHKDILKLESSIKELHDTFMEIATIIENQGEMIDRIEYQISNTKDFVLEGNKQLDQAIILRTKARRKAIFCYMILFSILTIFAIYTIYEFRST